METKLLNIQGKEQGTVALPEALFGKKPNPTFLHEVITAFLANQRAGSADVKTRSEVSGTGKKLYRNFLSCGDRNILRYGKIVCAADKVFADCRIAGCHIGFPQTPRRKSTIGNCFK